MTGARLRPHLLLALLVGGVACERLGEVRRCRQLARQVNGALDRIEATSVDAGRTPQALQQIARDYEGLASGLDAFDGGSPELTKAAGEYAGLARASARHAAALGSALAAANKPGATLESHELERLSRHEKALVTRIDEECRPK